MRALFVHLGKDTVVRANNIIAIIDWETVEGSENNQLYLKKAQMKDIVRDIAGGKPHSLVITPVPYTCLASPVLLLEAGREPILPSLGSMTRDVENQVCSSSGGSGMDNMDNRQQAYEAEQIQVLEGLDAVRRRPSMYIGSTDSRGLHHLFSEVLDNSIDEAMQGRCDTIQVIVHQDGSMTIIDNGSGIPVGIHPKTGKSAVETV